MLDVDISDLAAAYERLFVCVLEVCMSQIF